MNLKKTYVEKYVDNLYEIKLNTDLNDFISLNAMLLGGLLDEESPEAEATEESSVAE